MKRTISLIITLFALSISAQQNLYIGSYYVTTTEAEKLYGPGDDMTVVTLRVEERA